MNASSAPNVAPGCSICGRCPAWLMTVNDDPFVWFYYIYGHTTLPPIVFLWLAMKFLVPDRAGHADA